MAAWLMAGGRPTLYCEDTLVKAREYVSSGYLENEEVIPTIAGLAYLLSIARDTVYDWAAQEEKKEFSDIVRDLMSKQEVRLINSGLKGEFNASIAKLALTKHDYSDKQDSTLANADGTPLSVNFFGVKPDGS